MRDDLDKQLCEKYPLIFANRHADMTITAMCWGFEHGDGWYKIIDYACANIQGHIDNRNRFRDTSIKYNDALRKAIEGDVNALIQFYSNGKEAKDWMYTAAESDINRGEYRTVPNEIPQLVAAQIKEKFGTLRFYYEGGDEYCAGVIAMAESMSAVTCETCGDRGKLRGGGWIYTACDKHTDPNDMEQDLP